MSKSNLRLGKIQLLMLAAVTSCKMVATIFIYFVLDTRVLLLINQFVLLIAMVAAPPFGLFVALFVIARTLHRTVSRGHFSTAVTKYTRHRRYGACV